MGGGYKKKKIAWLKWLSASGVLCDHRIPTRRGNFYVTAIKLAGSMVMSFGQWKNILIGWVLPRWGILGRWAVNNER